MQVSLIVKQQKLELLLQGRFTFKSRHFCELAAYVAIGEPNLIKLLPKIYEK